MYGYPTNKRSKSGSNSNLNPRRQRTQGYAVSKTSGYTNSSRPNGLSNGKDNRAGRTPSVAPMPTGDKDATWGDLYRNN
jgi:hypothetical protein